VAKLNSIELPGVPPIPILYEDRAVLAIDKPRDWMLVPFSWQRTNRNLQAALVSSISAGDFWARSRGLKFLRYVHRLDAETTGILLLAKSQGAVESFGDLFESRRMEKTYLAVVTGEPKQSEWTCRLKLGPDPTRIGRHRVDPHSGKEAETHFKMVQTFRRSALPPRPQPSASPTVPPPLKPGSPPRAATGGTVAVRTLIECHPFTGRTHQIRLHLAEAGTPCVGDPLYGRPERGVELGLRAVRLAYQDPFTRRRIEIRAPFERFCQEYGFDIPVL
jgi:23S rRNA pseudouridine1911/1915/1917 synthase